MHPACIDPRKFRAQSGHARKRILDCSCSKALAKVSCLAFVLSVLSLHTQPLAERNFCMVSVRDALISAGAGQSDLAAILQALEDDRIGYTGQKDACGPFTELDPAILGQPPYSLNLKRCNIVTMAVKHAQGWSLMCT